MPVLLRTCPFYHRLGEMATGGRGPRSGQRIKGATRQSGRGSCPLPARRVLATARSYGGHIAPPQDWGLPAPVHRYRNGAGLPGVASRQRLSEHCRPQLVYRSEEEKVTGTSRYSANSSKTQHIVSQISRSTTGSGPISGWVAPSRKSARWPLLESPRWLMKTRALCDTLNEGGRLWV